MHEGGHKGRQWPSLATHFIGCSPLSKNRECHRVPARVARLLVAAVIGSRDQTKKGRLQEACLAALILYISPLSLGLSNIPRGRVSIVGA